MEIVDFNLILTQTAGHYAAQAVSAPLGSAEPSPMRWDDPQLLGATALATALTGKRPPDPSSSAFALALSKLRSGRPALDTLRTVGAGLYSALPDPVRALYGAAWQQVLADSGKVLRVYLHFDSPELGILPWEYLAADGQFLFTHARHWLVRYPESPNPTPPAIRLPGGSEVLDVLVCAADKEDGAVIAQEVRIIKEGLPEPNVSVLTAPDAYEIPEHMSRGYDTFHYLGQGRFDGEAMLVLANEGDKQTWISGDRLRVALARTDKPPVVFLNSRDGDGESSATAFTLLAFDLASQLPAVITMQFSLPPDKSARFLHEFYRALTAGQSVELGIANGRQALITEFTADALDWGSPALFMRVQTERTIPDGSLLNATTAPPPPVAGPPDPIVVSSGTDGSTVVISSTETASSLLERLAVTLAQAFPNAADVQVLTKYYLATPLETIRATFPEAADLPALFRGIIGWTRQQDPSGQMLAKLVDGAIKERPVRSDLKALRVALQAAGVLAGSPRPYDPSSASTGYGEESSSVFPESAAAPIPAIEPPPVTVETTGLVLTSAGRRLFTQELQTLLSWSTGPVKGRPGPRDQLLSRLPPELLGRKDPNVSIYSLTTQILYTAEERGQIPDASGKPCYALILVAETAAAVAGFGQPGALPAAGVFMALANALRKRVGLPPASLPLQD